MTYVRAVELRLELDRSCFEVVRVHFEAVGFASGFFVGAALMARLKTLKPALKMAKPMLVSVAQDGCQKSRQRDRDAPWRKMYKTSAWQRLRWKVLEEAHFTCAMCGKIEGNTRDLVADHIIPHKGDKTLFWDQGNCQALCRNCHDTTKKSMERGSKRRRDCKVEQGR